MPDDAAHAATPDPRAQRRADILAWLAFLALAIGFSTPPILTALKRPLGNKDYSLWQETGQRILHAQPLYPTDGAAAFPYMYPPTPAILLYAPLSILPAPLFVASLAILSSIAWAAALHLGVFLATGKAFRQHPLLYALPLGITAFYAWDTYLLGQVNIILLALMLGAFALIRGKRPILGGSLIALAASIKAFPIMAIGWIVWRREWRALAGLIGGLVLLLIAIPGAFRGFAFNLAELRTWLGGMLLNTGGDTLAQRSSIAFTYKNQALYAVAHRLLRPLPAGWMDDDTATYTVNLLNLSPAAATAAAAILALALCLLYVRSMPAKARRTRETDSLEWSALLILIALFTPLAWTYTMIALMPAYAAGIAFALRRSPGSRERRAAIAALSFATLLLSASLSQPWDHTTQALGLTMWGALTLAVTMCWMMLREKAASSTPTTSIPMPAR